MKKQIKEQVSERTQIRHWRELWAFFSSKPVQTQLSFQFLTIWWRRISISTSWWLVAVNIGGFTTEEFALAKGSLLFWKIPRKGKHIQWANNSRLKTFGQTGGLTFDFSFPFSSYLFNYPQFWRSLKHCFKKILWQILSDLSLWISVRVGFEKVTPCFSTHRFWFHLAWKSL